jgi:hypothetical protein
LQGHYFEMSQDVIHLSEDIAAVVFNCPLRDKNGGHCFVLFARAAKLTVDDL